MAPHIIAELDIKITCMGLKLIKTQNSSQHCPNDHIKIDDHLGISMKLAESMPMVDLLKN